MRKEAADIRKLKKYKPTRFMAEGSAYNRELADLAVSFIGCLKHTKGEWYGQNFELIDWQEQIIRDLFGIVKPNGYRQFNTAYIEIAKKQGKSELAAAVALLLTCGDMEYGGEVYGNAYAQIIRNGKGEVIGLYPLMPTKMTVDRDSKGQIYYLYTRGSDDSPVDDENGQVYLPPEQVLHIPGLGYDGIVGYSPIAMAKNAVGMAIACEEYGAKFFANDAAPGGVL